MGNRASLREEAARSGGAWNALTRRDARSAIPQGGTAEEHAAGIYQRAAACPGFSGFASGLGGDRGRNQASADERQGGSPGQRVY